MSKRNIGFGLFILSIGVIWILVNVGIISLMLILDSLLVLWPLLLVVAGVNMIFRQNHIVRIVTWLVFLAVIITYGYVADPSDRNDLTREQFIYEKLSETEKVDLKLSLGGVQFDIEGGSGNLIDADMKGYGVTESIRYGSSDETAYINIRNTKKTFILGRSLTGETCNLKLNNDVVWDMYLKVGAVKGSLDLSDIRVDKLDIDTGAGKLDLIFGNLHDMTDVKIDAGASSIDVSLPEDVGARIKMNGAINSTNFGSLGWKKNNGYYTSPNYSQADSKIDFDVNMGVGSFKIE